MFLIDKYKQIRSTRFLSNTVNNNYAFVGIGNHSLNNLYPVIHHLQVPIKYICCTNEQKAQRISNKYIGVKGSANLSEVLDDSEVKAVFISAKESAHFKLALATLEAGKQVFIEKPPCSNISELEKLIEVQKQSANTTVLVGLQKRYAPAVRILQNKLAAEKIIDYTLQFHTGLYPEGGALTELFIHSIDLCAYLFGKASVEYRHINRVGNGYTMTIVLKHDNGVIGRVDLSTHHSWRDAKESLVVNTLKGEYDLDNMESLTYIPKQMALMGIPVEKLIKKNKSVEYLYDRNSFTPIIANNQIVSAGYYSEIEGFVKCVEQVTDKYNRSSLESLRNTYHILQNLES